jgi:hypothetical protein
MTLEERNLFCPICHANIPHIVDLDRGEATCRNLGCTRPFNFLDKLALGIKPKPEVEVMTHGGSEKRV